MEIRPEQAALLASVPEAQRRALLLHGNVDELLPLAAANALYLSGIYTELHYSPRAIRMEAWRIESVRIATSVSMHPATFGGMQKPERSADFALSVGPESECPGTELAVKSFLWAYVGCKDD